MSYILEALKKAEAERQLGSAPTIHASPAAHAAPNAAARSRKPLLIGLGAGVLLASAAAVVTWRHQAAPAAPAVLALATPGTGAAQVAATVGAPAPAIVVTDPGSPATATAVPQAPAAAVPQAPAEAVPQAPTAALRSPEREFQARQSAPARGPALEPPPTLAAAPALAAAPTAAPARGARAARAGAPAPEHANPAARAAMPSAPGADDNVRPLTELPDSIQREVPKVAFGGYIYSPNPADRLLLVDKALRHEGEEVAPGLVLEKLLPKAAVMNYRGYRYRVAY